jgi:hypothetical protein
VHTFGVVKKSSECLVEWLSFLLHIWEVLILFIGCFGCILSLFTQSRDENAAKIFKQ